MNVYRVNLVLVTRLTVKDDLSYLGKKINDKSRNVHTDSKIYSCRRVFFSLQGAGLCKEGVSPSTAAELLRKLSNPVTFYSMLRHQCFIIFFKENEASFYANCLMFGTDFNHFKVRGQGLKKDHILLNSRPPSPHNYSDLDMSLLNMGYVSLGCKMVHHTS